MRTTTTKIILHALACLLIAGVMQAQVETKKGAVVLYGSDSNCSQPATIDFQRVRNATPEWKTIKTDGVKKGSARHDLLIADMNARIKTAVAEAARAASRDCVVRNGDIKDANGLPVSDLTNEVIKVIDDK